MHVVLVWETDGFHLHQVAEVVGPFNNEQEADRWQRQWGGEVRKLTLPDFADEAGRRKEV